MSDAPRPDYSARTLALFLQARQVARRDFDKDRPPFDEELIDLTGLAHSDIRAAFAGRLVDGTKRAAIWAVLGHFPADAGIVLTDDGGQVSSASRAAGAPAGRTIGSDGRSALRPSPEGGQHG